MRHFRGVLENRLQCLGLFPDLIEGEFRIGFRFHLDDIGAVYREEQVRQIFVGDKTEAKNTHNHHRQHNHALVDQGSNHRIHGLELVGVRFRRLAAILEDPLQVRRDKQQGIDKGEAEGDNHRQRNHIHQLAAVTRQEQQGHKGDHGGEHAGHHRREDACYAFGYCPLNLVALFHQGDNLVTDHHRIVDNNADNQDQGREGKNVENLAKDRQHSESTEDTDRDRHRHPQGDALAQKQRQGHQYQGETDQTVTLDNPSLLLDITGEIRTNAQSVFVAQQRLLSCQQCLDRIGGADNITALVGAQIKQDTSVAVDRAVDLTLLKALLDLSGHILQLQTGREGDHHLLQILEAFQLRGGNEFGAVLKLLQPPATDQGVALGDQGGDLINGQPVTLQGFRLQGDQKLRVAQIGGMHLTNTLHLSQFQLEVFGLFAQHAVGHITGDTYHHKVEAIGLFRHKGGSVGDPRRQIGNPGQGIPNILIDRIRIGDTALQFHRDI